MKTHSTGGIDLTVLITIVIFVLIVALVVIIIEAVTLVYRCDGMLQ